MQYELNVLDDAVPQVKKTARYLYCDLTPEEQRERGELLANISNEIDTLEDEAKRVAGEFKTRILETRSRYSIVKSAVLTRREEREVICTEHLNTKRGEVYTVRDDLGTIVDARVMTDRERQLHLPNVEVPTDEQGHEGVIAETNGHGEGAEAANSTPPVDAAGNGNTENPTASASNLPPLEKQVKEKKRGRTQTATA